MKQKTKTLPAIRITESTSGQISLPIDKLNQSSIVPLSLQDFRRLSYLFLARKVLSGEPIDIRLER